MGVGRWAVILVMVLFLVNMKCYRAKYMVEMMKSSRCGGSIEECLMMEELELEKMMTLESQVIIRMLGKKKPPETGTGYTGQRNQTGSCGGGKPYSQCKPGKQKPKQKCSTYERTCHNPPPPPPAASLTIFS